MEEDSAGAAPVGDRLRGLREAQGLDLSDIAARTRIPLRHLHAVEASDYAALPSQTYALGFVRSYGRAVGADEAELATQLRAELGREPVVPPGVQSYEPVDPARLPSKLLAWTALILAVLVIGGYGLWRTQWQGGDAPVETIAAAPTATAPGNDAAPVQPAPAAATGQVTLAATAPVWVRISDGGNTLAMRELAAGERYDVPLTAADPRIQTGKAEALTVTVDGRPVAPLGPAARTLRNVSLKAADLSATPVAPAAPSGDNAVTPAPAR